MQIWDMTKNVALIVFTDLDGTLIDHDTYAWAGAQEALTSLKVISAGVVLASSKTSVEIAPLRCELGLEAWPAIVENGAGLLPPFSTQPPDAEDYDRRRAVLKHVSKDLRRLFLGFGDVPLAQLVDLTGLAPDAARLAQQRAYSEPGQWRGTQDQKTAFLAELKAQGVTAQQGGRFLTLSFGGNKVDQMRKIIEHYQPQHTIALGDAPNDVQMLENAEFGVIIHNPHRPPLARLRGEETGHIMRSRAAGPVGWNAAIRDLLTTLALQ
jgi:mannosyl-3-phosphoglycerate phosphatase